MKDIAVAFHNKNAFLFPSKEKGNKSIHRSTYHRHLKKVCENLNIDFSAHSTRKFFAQELYKKTGDIFEVQKQLNHKFIADTCLYLDLDFEQLLRAATDPKVLQVHKND
jgi:site-specific recombinase XerC